MKKIIVILILLFALPCFAGSITKTCHWKQDGIKADFGGWNLYYSETTGGPYSKVTTIPYVAAQTEYSQSVSLAMPSYDGTVKTLYFVLTNFNKVTSKESGYSNEASALCDFTNEFGVPFEFIITATP